MRLSRERIFYNTPCPRSRYCCWRSHPHEDIGSYPATPASRPAHMKRLYELSRSDTKIWKPFAAGDHNSSVLEEGYFETIAKFINNITNDDALRKKAGAL